jgi:hypothetical protein
LMAPKVTTKKNKRKTILNCAKRRY